MTTTNAGIYGPEAVLGQTGTPAVTTPVTVYEHGTQTAAALYTDNTMTAAAENPVTTDGFGNLAFYAVPGLYDLSFTVGGVATTLTVFVPPWMVDSEIPTGTIFHFAGASIPTGWLLCDGSAVSRTTYAELFSVIDTTWGAGDGESTFNLPDFRGRVIVGTQGPGGNSQPTLPLGDDSYGGEQEHTLLEAELAEHDHGGQTAENSVSHAHATPADTTVEAPGSTLNVVTSGGTGVSFGSQTTGNESAEHVHAIPTDGSNTPHNNMQPFGAATIIIKC